MTEVVCHTCDGRVFKDQSAFTQHCKDSNAHKRGLIECLLCEVPFRTDKSYQQHLATSSFHDPRSYCVECNRYYEDQEDLDDHKTENHREWLCSHQGCNMVFKTQGDFDNHKQGHYRTCPFCSIKFDSQQIDDHLYNAHLYCKKCKSTYNSVETLKDHRKTNENHFWCPPCGVDFNSSSDLGQHCKKVHEYCGKCNLTFFNVDDKKAHLVSSVSHFYCEKCDLEFNSHGDLKNHSIESMSHHSCKSCRAEFENSEALSRHYLVTNSHHYCYACRRLFTTKGLLKFHLTRIVHSKAHHYCKPCELEFMTADELKRHVKQGSGTEGHFYCLFCDEMLTLAKSFEEHNDAQHHTCKPCELVFATPTDLKLHVKQYIGITGHFYCPWCDEVFTEAIKFGIHNDAYHHPCKPCKLVFSTQGQFKNHVRENVGSDGHFYCPSCDKIFDGPKTLAKHKVECDKYYSVMTSEADSDETKHLVAHLTAEHHECGHCKQSFDSKIALSEHRCKLETPCHICGELFASARAAMEHQEASPSECYVKPDQLYLWIGVHDTNKRFTTPQLDHPAIERYRLVVEKHWDGGSQTYNCHLCDSASTEQKEFVSHMTGTLHQPRRFRCPSTTCSLRFIKFGGLLEHLSTSKCSIEVQQSEADGLEFLKEFLV